MSNATGIDVSAYQAPLTVAYLDSLGVDFAYTKATNGTNIIDPNLAANWATLAAWGKPRGVYHEFVPADNPVTQANYCYQAVVDAGGFEPGNFAAVVASDYAGTTGAEVAEWCGEFRSLAGPRVPVFVYSDLSLLPSLPACTSSPLWCAWPSATPPTTAQVAPWPAWTMWQNGESGTDTDQFNGTAAALAAWLNGGDMAAVFWTPDGAYLLDGGRYVGIPDQADETLMADAGFTVVGKPGAGISTAFHAALVAAYAPTDVTLTGVTFPSFTVTPDAS